MLTVHGIGWRRGAAAPAAKSCGGARAELGEEGAGVALRASRSHCQAQSVPVEALRGSGRTEAHRRRGIEVAEVFTGGEVVGEIRRVRGRDQEGLAWGKLWTSRRCFCAAWPELRCVGVAWQQRLRGAARRSEVRAVALRLGVAAADGRRRGGSGFYL